METTCKYEWSYATVPISPCSKNDHINIGSKLLLVLVIIQFCQVFKSDMYKDTEAHRIACPDARMVEEELVGLVKVKLNILTQVVQCLFVLGFILPLPNISATLGKQVSLFLL